jgi:hypothetical protein
MTNNVGQFGPEFTCLDVAIRLRFLLLNLHFAKLRSVRASDCPEFVANACSLWDRTEKKREKESNPPKLPSVCVSGLGSCGWGVQGVIGDGVAHVAKLY